MWTFHNCPLLILKKLYVKNTTYQFSNSIVQNLNIKNHRANLEHCNRNFSERKPRWHSWPVIFIGYWWTEEIESNFGYSGKIWQQVCISSATFVQVVDVNDNAPQFFTSPTVYRVPEVIISIISRN